MFTANLHGHNGEIKLEFHNKGLEICSTERSARPAGATARGPRGSPSPTRAARRSPRARRASFSHSPDTAREAAARGIDVVLAGHTHGGQVRLPGIGALLTRTRLGRRYDRGLFQLDDARAGGTWLYVNPGIGTSLLPVRFCDPPGWALVDLRPSPG